MSSGSGKRFHSLPSAKRARANPRLACRQSLTAADDLSCPTPLAEGDDT